MTTNKPSLVQNAERARASKLSRFAGLLAVTAALLVPVQTSHAAEEHVQSAMHIGMRVSRPASMPTSMITSPEQVVDSLGSICGDTDCAEVTVGVAPSGHRLVTVYF